MNRFLDFWNALLGRKRLPRNHDELFSYGEKAGRGVGELEKGGKLLGGDPPVVQVVDGEVEARAAHFGQRKGKRLNRTEAKGKRHTRKAKRHEKIANDARGERVSTEPTPRLVVDFFVSRVWLYLLSIGLFVWLLETTGMLTSLISYEAVLGPIRFPMSIAAGAILVGAGHGAGHLLHSALENRAARLGYLLGTAAVLLIGFITVVSLGIGRDANTAAADRFHAVGTLQAEATRLDGRAEELLQPLPGLPAEDGGQPVSSEDRHTAKLLRGEAQDKRRQANRLDAEARDERTLDFFAPIQVLGLAVGTIAGFFFAGAAPLREYRRLTARADRHDRRAVRHRGRAERWEAKVADIKAAIGRMVHEEFGLGKVVLGHHEQTRLTARGSTEVTTAASQIDPDEVLTWVLDPVNRQPEIPAAKSENGDGDPERIADLTKETQG